MLLLGHRGASADAPENTLTAFTEAVAQGADGVELDVRRCGSGELVVCHDERLDRLAGLPWDVSHTSYWKLRRADVGSRLGFAPATIPPLEEVLAALPSHFLVNLELKCEGLDDRGLSEQVGAFVLKEGLAHRVVVSSFNPLCLFRLASSHPEVRRGQLLDPDRRFFTQAHLVSPLLAPYSVHPHHSQVTSERVRHWHQRGLWVMAWTVDDPETARSLEQWGADALITNRPGKLRRELAQKSSPRVKL
ncbi:MAG: glycerophosphodiester phosphodiesterase [Myxococcales bacterium]|nr:glycerophosphodiester phosphodiesterase [Myxococcales bacterium]